MNKQKEKKLKREARGKRARAKIFGTASTPRLSVFRSNRSMYTQLINDSAGKTVASAHSREIKKKDSKKNISFELGKLLAQKAVAKKIKNAVFDRGGYKYHGRVKAVAEGARESGLKF